MRGRFAWPFLAFAALPCAAQAAAPQSPAPATEPTVMIVEFPRGAPMIGFPRRCPGATEDEPLDEICLAELYEGRGLVVRHLSGPRIRRHDRVRLTAHARRWAEGTRMLVATRPFDDRGTTGHFAFWWHLPERDGDFCISARNLAEWGNGSITRVLGRGYRRNFRAVGYLERDDFRCIRGESASAPDR